MNFPEISNIQFFCFFAVAYLAADFSLMAYARISKKSPVRKK